MSANDKNVNEDHEDDDDLDDNPFADDDLGDDYLDGMFAADDDANEHLVEAMMNDLGVVSLCFFHLYFSTAGQRPLFEDEALRGEVHHQLSRVCKRLCCPESAISVGRDHAHIVCRLHPELSVDKLVNRFKGDTQAWLLEHAPELGPQIWQENYGGCSVSGSEIGTVRRYLEEESERHQVESYEDEFRRLCTELDIEIEEPDCWK